MEFDSNNRGGARHYRIARVAQCSKRRSADDRILEHETFDCYEPFTPRS